MKHVRKLLFFLRNFLVVIFDGGPSNLQVHNIINKLACNDGKWKTKHFHKSIESHENL